MDFWVALAFGALGLAVLVPLVILQRRRWRLPKTPGPTAPEATLALVGLALVGIALARPSYFKWGDAEMQLNEIRKELRPWAVVDVEAEKVPRLVRSTFPKGHLQFQRMERSDDEYSLDVLVFIVKGDPEYVEVRSSRGTEGYLRTEPTPDGLRCMFHVHQVMQDDEETEPAFSDQLIIEAFFPNNGGA